jgi:hypothetical protein
LKKEQAGAITYIPDNDGTSLPANTSLKVLRQGDVVVQELEEVV